MKTETEIKREAFLRIVNDKRYALDVRNKAAYLLFKIVQKATNKVVAKAGE